MGLNPTRGSSKTSSFTLCVSAGKEYVCVLRLHDAIPSEAKLAQVRGVEGEWEEGAVHGECD